jgi:hypothetical protein
VRKKVITGTVSLVALATLSLGLLTGFTAPAEDGMKYEVKITNLTRGQPLSPVVVATHTRDLPALFAVGSPASGELAAVAEDADNSGLLSLWDPAANTMVAGDLQTITGSDGPIMPGETASAIMEGGGTFRQISLVSMLVNTNDAFIALNTEALPRADTDVHWSPAYDAGSEANNEGCDFIPGPACGSEFMRDIADAEGYVHIHAAIHGIGELDPVAYDWRNPVALIEIRRLP